MTGVSHDHPIAISGAAFETSFPSPSSHLPRPSSCTSSSLLLKHHVIPTVRPPSTLNAPAFADSDLHPSLLPILPEPSPFLPLICIALLQQRPKQRCNVINITNPYEEVPQHLTQIRDRRAAAQTAGIKTSKRRREDLKVRF